MIKGSSKRWQRVLNQMRDNEYLQQVFHHIQDGIIIMTADRTILKMNPAAERLTGWRLGEQVPFCSYCQEREKKPSEHRCYLIEHKEVPYFISEMQTGLGTKIEVEMSAELIGDESGEKQYLFVLRDRSFNKLVDEAQMSKKMIRALIEAEEKEHKRLAQELHDGVGQSLFSISVALQAIESYVDAKTHALLSEYIGEVRTELQKVMNDVNEYSHRLRPHSLDQLGLEAALKTLVVSIQKKQPDLEVIFHTKTIERCDPSVEINVYRVVQEALHNIQKYAQATRVEIDLSKNDTHITMKIIDNGIGFDRKNIQSEGLGLKHMEERIEQLGGICNIHSEIGKGTLIDIIIPKWRPIV